MKTLPYLLFLLLLGACLPERDVAPIQMQETPYLLRTPAYFPAMDIPADNALTQERVELGRRLFFDPMLSEDGSVSCISCHNIDKAFTDGLAVSEGIYGRQGTRNTPTLANIGYHPYFFREGGQPSLARQAQGPIEEAHEMNSSLLETVERMNADPTYVEQSLLAYGRKPDPWVLTRALAAFQRTLVSASSAYDRYRQGEENALSAAAQRGLRLFEEELNCQQCHGGFDFTEYAILNNGLYLVYADSGLFRATLNPNDWAKFKVPTLRNIALTAPYMHDGSLPDLEAVIEHYASGGKAHPQKDPRIQPFSISESEQQDLIAFLESLTDSAFIEPQQYTSR